MVKLNETDIKIAKRYLEWKEDPVKFIEECCMMPTPGGDENIVLYEPQKKIVRSFYNDHYLILLKSRQIGMSTICQLICAHLTVFYDNIKIGVISKSRDHASSFCRDTRSFISRIKPEYRWIIPGFDTDQTQKYILNNGSSLTSSAVNPNQPDAVFRGSALAGLIVDECAFIKKIDDVWTSIAPSLSKAQKSAEDRGIPFGTIILSTPNGTQGTGQWYFQKWTRASSPDNSNDSLWKSHKIHWSEIPDFSDDPNWYKKQCNQLDNDPRKIQQELECKFISSGDALFNEHVQVSLQESCEIDPNDVIYYKEGGELWRFGEYSTDQFFLVGIDCASAAGSDYSAVEVIDYETMNQVMEYKGKLEPKLFAEVVKMILKGLPNHIAIVENTGGYGQVVLTELMTDGKYQFNVYHEKKMRQKQIGPGTPPGSKFKSNQIIPGLSTNSRSRPLILEALFESVNENPNTVKSNRLAAELLCLVNKRGRVEAASGFNDDLAMAYGFCCYVRKYGQDNLPVVRTASDKIKIKSFNKDLINYNSSNKLSSTYDPEKTVDQLNSDILKHIKKNYNKFTKNIDMLQIYDLVGKNKW